MLRWKDQKHLIMGALVNVMDRHRDEWKPMPGWQRSGPISALRSAGPAEGKR
jgi:hypothetical protein